MEHKEAKLYPTLPSDHGSTNCFEERYAERLATAPEGEVCIVEGTAHSYRLQNINEIQKEITAERDKRADLSKKYHRAVTVIDAVDNTLVVSTMGLGVAGIGILSTIIAAPVAIAMEGVALGTGLLSLVVRLIKSYR